MDWLGKRLSGLSARESGGPPDRDPGARQALVAANWILEHQQRQDIRDPPIPLALAHGVVLIQYRAENVHITPVFGPAALNIFPRVGHLHVNVDSLPWHRADASDTGTIDVKDLPPGPHKITIDLVDGNHQLFPGQSKAVTFIMPETVAEAH